jgi:hypothetical protein
MTSTAPNVAARRPTAAPKDSRLKTFGLWAWIVAVIVAVLVAVGSHAVSWVGRYGVGGAVRWLAGLIAMGGALVSGAWVAGDYRDRWRHRFLSLIAGILLVAGLALWWPWLPTDG